ncbi:hypothetical protein MVEN_01554400 [Mycena venus]|uniref:Transmembrane protein n=1 Tax=Mycena venus TaxID=2733690 RepID=A0A8H6XS82_9AGAR|nr:hypothetical protein MVEN_01554400 [Mycena venus]
MLNMTIDDASPLIQYQPDRAWTQNVSNEAYYNGHTSTYTQNAFATFKFWGTSIIVKGLKNPSHGNYTVELDGSPHQFNGYIPHSDEWRSIIYNSSVLEPGPHTLTITNDDWWTLDIDSITWFCDVGGTNATNSSLWETTVDDGEGAFSWFPHGSWSVLPSNLSMFSQGTGHSTSQVDASVNFTFSGNFHQVFVSPPNRPAQYFNASRNIFYPKVLLYFGDGFGPGNNTVTLKNEGSGLFQVDHAIVYAANTPTTPTSTTHTLSVVPPTRSVTPSSATPVIPADLPIHRGLSAGVIAAITLTTLLFVCLIAFVLFLLQRNKTLWSRLQGGYKVQSQFDIGTPPNGSVSPMPFTAAPLPMRSKANLQRDNDDYEAQPLNRAFTMESHLTASTLVADAGSNATRAGRPFSLKALRLASRWGPNTPTSSQTNLSDTPFMRHSASSRRFTLSPTTRHLSRSPSVRHLLQEDSQYYDPHAAAVAGLEEVPEGSIEEVLRHPIRRNEPSTYNHWQTGLP